MKTIKKAVETHPDRILALTAQEEFALLQTAFRLCARDLAHRRNREIELFNQSTATWEMLTDDIMNEFMEKARCLSH